MKRILTNSPYARRIKIYYLLNIVKNLERIVDLYMDYPTTNSIALAIGLTKVRNVKGFNI